uniref:Uncharacterized protein n=1 Tax=Rhizophora mucronata TaxID=61149 RepID=A0A2P2PBQ8_RHIMU
MKILEEAFKGHTRLPKSSTDLSSPNSAAVFRPGLCKASITKRSPACTCLWNTHLRDGILRV